MIHTVTVQIENAAVTAEVDDAPDGFAIVHTATDSNGNHIHVTADHLDAWESALFEAAHDKAICEFWQMIEESDVQGYARRCYV